MKKVKHDPQKHDANTLHARIPTESREGGVHTIEFRTVDKFFRMASLQKDEKEAICERVREQYESQFNANRRVGQRYIDGFLMFQVLERVTQPMKLPSATVRVPGAGAILESAVNDTLKQAVRETMLQDCFLNSKLGAGKRFLLYGDAFIRSGIKEGAGFPTIFENASITDVYIDPYAIDMSSPTSLRDADEWAIKYTYSWDDVVEQFEGAEEGAMPGTLPFGIDDDDDNDEYSDEQKHEINERETEVLYYRNKSLDVSYCFIGANAYMVENKRELNLFHLKCFESQEGFYNRGIGELFYKLHETYREVMNKALSAVDDILSPIYVMSGASRRQNDIQDKVAKAVIDKAKGGKGIVFLDDTMDGQVRVERLIGDSIPNELERIYAQLDKEVKRIGINIDDIFFEKNQTLGQTQIAEANANAFIEQRIDINTGEFRRIYTSILEDIREYVTENDETPIEISNTELLAQSTGDTIPTLGTIAKILKKYDFYVEVDLKSGSFPSKLTQLQNNAEILQNIALIAPGSKAHMRELKEFARLRGRIVSDDEIQAPQVQPPEKQMNTPLPPQK
jgi:hypothetical protein